MTNAKQMSGQVNPMFWLISFNTVQRVYWVINLVVLIKAILDLLCSSPVAH